eukprot:TRINITY_DN13262_c0_g2_i3.p2 TRINITY_DN13262_c0_g2~~TRINITY_DN13262_c0_g2_i3.p2  ORF type:complete len:346 (-),score=73.33 TRINITY_DN13262_c0_g2_i3:423-1460(-)
MQLITAVVVDSFADMRKHDVNGLAVELEDDERDEKRCLRNIFEALDADDSGEVSLEELIIGTRQNKEFGQWLRVMDLDGNDLQRLFAMLDVDKNGSIEVEEFIDTLYRMKNAESRTTMKMVKHVVETVEQTINRLAIDMHCLHGKFESLQTQVAGSPPASPRRAKRPLGEEGAALREAEARLQEACSIALRAALSAAEADIKASALREESQSPCTVREVGFAQELEACASWVLEQRDDVNTAGSSGPFDDGRRNGEPVDPKADIGSFSDADFSACPGGSRNLAMDLQYPLGRPPAGQLEPGRSQQPQQGQQEASCHGGDQQQAQKQEGRQTSKPKSVRFVAGMKQ